MIKLFNFRMLQGLISLYRFTLSPLLGGECRFYPTCSAFAADAVKVLPTGRAIREIIGRLLKCHPFHAGGFYPVPRL